MSDSPRRIMVVVPYPTYKLITFYVVVWICFFLFPLYIVYSALSDISFSPSEYLAVAIVSFLVVVRFGAVASLPFVLVLSGYMLTFITNAQWRPMLYFVVVGMCIVYGSLIIRSITNIAIIRRNAQLKDQDIEELNAKSLPIVLKGQQRKRRFATVFVACYLVILITVLAQGSHDGIIILLGSALLHNFTSYYWIEFDRLFIYDNGTSRYCPYFYLSYLDRQIIQFLSYRGAGLLVFCMLYGFVISTFAFSYYLIDHCPQNGSICRFIDKAGFKHDQTETRSTSNFVGLDSLLSCDKVNDCNFSISRFLPYLYFSVVTSTTVGYGDIYPRSVTAAWLVIIHHLIAVALLAGVAGQVAGWVVSQRA